MSNWQECARPLHHGLSNEQHEAVHLGTGPYVLAATAGAGKTRVVVHRMEQLMYDGISPTRIGAFTFAKDAAGEMQERGRVLGFSDELRIGTLHSLCYEILREDGPQWGGQFNVDDRNQISYALKDIIERDYRDRGLDPGIAAKLIGLAKADCLSYHPSVGPIYEEEIYRLFKEKSDKDWLAGYYAEVYQKLEQVRINRGLIDFDDMLILGWLTLVNDEGAKARWQDRFDYILVDEAQDASTVQNAVAMILGEKHSNLMLVGDVQQSLYSWRGAKPAEFVAFANKFTIKQLHTNYRSTQEICRHATMLTAGRHWNVTGETIPRADAPSDPQSATVTEYANPEEEARSIAAQLLALREDGVRLGDVAILYRITALLAPLELALLQAGVTYTVWSGMPFYDRKEVKDLLAYLRVAALRDPTEENAKRAIHAPFRYLGKVYVSSVEQYARDNSIAFLDALTKFTDAKPSQVRNGNKYYELLRGLNGLVAAGATPAKVLGAVLDRTGYLQYIRKQDGEDGPDPDSGRAAHVHQLLRVAESFQDVHAFLDYVDKMQQILRESRGRRTPDAVVLATIHKCVHPDTFMETSRGLEPIRDVAPTGIVATPTGAGTYNRKFTRARSRALRITTRSGYQLTVSPDHGLTVWDAGHVRREARTLVEGSLLRLRLGCTIAPTQLVAAPDVASAEIDLRARRYMLPQFVDEQLAQFLGLFVADGTLYHAGFRLKKRYQSVVDWMANAAERLFGCSPHNAPDTDGCPSVEVNSTFLSVWLGKFGGLEPNAKAIPACILQSPLNVQASFLRGLFEDGTVNEEDGHVDHLHFENKTPSLCRTVQVMLLRFGIISAVRERLSTAGHPITSVYIYGQSARRFAEQIGFTAPEKNARLAGTFAAELNYSVPILPHELEAVRSVLSQSTLGNGRTRGSLSRHTVAEIVKNAGPTCPVDLADRLGWHYEPVKTIEEVECETMCIEVPDGSRFLQNGFDGWNSKGLEFRYVFGVGWNDGTLPVLRNPDQDEELRLAFVCLTRAKQQFSGSYCRRIVTPAGQIDGHPSPFIRMAGLTTHRYGSSPKRRPFRTGRAPPRK